MSNDEKEKQEKLKKEIFSLLKVYYQEFHEPEEFIPGKTYIPYSGRVFDEQEIIALVDSALDFWLTSGKYANQFEKEFSEFLGTSYCILANSGSSANLLAMSALTSAKLESRRLKPGDEVITVACAFPTTVSPIVQNNLVPVFIDVELGSYNIITERIEGAISDKTKAIFLAHTLGNPFDIDKVLQIAEDYDLWLVEDNCDALGSKYGNQHTGTFGDIGTFSFYPAHHITMGEGGACVTDDPMLRRIIESYRDWGRDCWCGPGQDNSCKKRFGWKLGDLTEGYDHKYIYSHLGYNLKVTDMQAAVGVAQLRKLNYFIEKRKENWNYFYNYMKKYEDCFTLPQSNKHSDPCWFGFPLTVKEEAGFTRNQIVNYLESNRIATRALFSGNILRHPCFKDVEFRVHDSLENTNSIMDSTFWIGVYPGLNRDMREYVNSKFEEFMIYNAHKNS